MYYVKTHWHEEDVFGPKGEWKGVVVYTWKGPFSNLSEIKDSLNFHSILEIVKIENH